MSIFIHGILDAPDPPDWMLQKAECFDETAIMNNWGDSYTNRILIKNGKTYNNAFNRSNLLGEDELTWVKNNISHLALDVRISRTQPGLERCGAHIDKTRNYTLVFLLDTGGPDHRTVFYKEKGVDELHRPLLYHVDDYDNLVEIKSIQLQQFKWNLLNARVLHSIENITEGRKSIQVSFNDFDKGFKFLNLEYVN